MRWLRFLTGLIAAVIALGVFAVLGSPRDPLRVLGSHSYNEQVSYSEELDPFSGQIVFNCHRTADIRGLSMSEVNARLHADRPKPTEQFLLFLNDSHLVFDPRARAQVLLAHDVSAGTVVYVAQLSPVQVLWVRVTHPGTNPFGKSIASAGRVEHLITARP